MQEIVILIVFVVSMALLMAWHKFTPKKKLYFKLSAWAQAKGEAEEFFERRHAEYMAQVAERVGGAA